MRKSFVFLLLAMGCLTTSCLNPRARSSETEKLLKNRQAFRSCVAGKPEKAKAYLNDPDSEIRLGAYYALASNDLENSLETLLKGMQDENVEVRKMIATALASLAATNPSATAALIEAANNDSSPDVRRIASVATWPFHREIKLLRNDPDWDHEVAVVHSFEIPDEDWRIATDPMQNGHLKNWHQPTFNDQDWQKIKLGNWETQGLPDYDGVAWYRIRFNMPAKIDSNAVELAFGAVDEVAWVWMNGTYLGCHDLGTLGWDVPFALDCRREIKWGEENILVVRVLDTAFAGGIWKPINVEVLK